MKFLDNNPSLFCEEVGTATMLFEKWNDCERTVVIYAFLKRLRYQNLKFLQYSIESVLAHMTTVELQAFEFNSNSSEYLKQLIFAYNNDDSITYESNSTLNLQSALENCQKSKYLKKENILKEILEMLPLLRPGNNEAKSMYLSLIPLAVKDTVKQTVSAELTQQIISYLLIHPAIFNDDRRSLNHWLRFLEDHIQSTYATYCNSKNEKQKITYFNPNNKFETQTQNVPTLNKKISQNSGGGGVTMANDKSFSDNAHSQLHQQHNIWQAIAPPNQNFLMLNGKDLTDSNKQLNSVPDLTDEFSQMQLQSDSSTKHSSDSLKLIYDGQSASSETSHSETLVDPDTTEDSSTGGNNDRHISFSKNGREILDYESNSTQCDKCNTQIVGYNSAMLCCYNQQKQQHEKQNKTLKIITAPRWSLDNKMTSLKTRRSNSLTTSTILSSSSSTATVNYSNSSENLPQFLTKPRSFSLTIDQPKNVLIQSGSETRLDELKPGYMQFQTHFIGMSNIGQWLKSLRLHKYVGIFANMTYDNMLEISEDYLQSLGVTKGASHKLSKCIEKLKDRLSTMSKVEKDLRSAKITLKTAVDELTNIVLTPMKPVDNTPDNVAAKFIQLLDLIVLILTRAELNLPQDEEAVNSLLWILERSIHNEAFLAYSNHLKEHKFKLSKIRLSYVPKAHSNKTNNNGGSGNGNGTTSGFIKPRWNGGKTRKNSNSNNNNNNNGNGSGNTVINLNSNLLGASINGKGIVSIGDNVLKSENKINGNGGSKIIFDLTNNFSTNST